MTGVNIWVYIDLWWFNRGNWKESEETELIQQEAVVPIDDDMGEDADSEVEEEVPVELIPIPSVMKPPPMFASVAAEVETSAESYAPLPGRVQQDQAGTSDVPMTGGRQVDVMAGDSPAD